MFRQRAAASSVRSKQAKQRRREGLRDTQLMATCLCLVGVLSGCTRLAPPANTGAAAGQAVLPRITTQTQPGGAVATHASQVRSWPDVAKSVDQVQGLKWTVVLQEGNKAYVGAFPDHTETPTPDRSKAPRTTYDFPKSYDTPAELAKKSPDDLIRALQEHPPRVDTYDLRPRERSGALSPEKQAEVARRVKQALPGVNAVYITTDTASAAVLRGYAEYIQAGGDMSRFMDEFHRRIQMIWPNGQGLDPNHPSAAPRFGALGTPADNRTPVRGPARP
ncbi:MAG: YhcN/YlaJ family sporulation lipoprotein [Alicyclobacillus sp.]|nr:YhcN/YlaJ family sporulation lipoprotein [Alicyclobacillus sp.]